MIAAIGVAEPRGGLDERVEHRLQIEGRAADDLEHVAGRGLVFERLLRSPVRSRQFVEQPDILRSRSPPASAKVCQQVDLLVAETARPRGG